MAATLSANACASASRSASVGSRRPVEDASCAIAGFVAEFQIFVGAVAVYPVLAVVGLVGIVITAALFLRMLQKLFLGPLPIRWADFRELGRVEILALGALLAVVIGVIPAWLLNVADSFAGPLVGRG